jgi:hypothetical protein
MAFALDRLSVVAYADGFTLWHYRGETDTRAAISAPGFFTPARHMLRANDMVVAAGSDGMALMALSGTGPALAATAF